MDTWLDEAIARLGSDAGALALTDAEVQTLLSLARVAAHSSGERINAPLVCYLVGLEVARSGRSLEDVAEKAAGEPL